MPELRQVYHGHDSSVQRHVCRFTFELREGQEVLELSDGMTMGARNGVWVHCNERNPPPSS